MWPRSGIIGLLCAATVAVGSLPAAMAQQARPDQGAQRFVEYCAACHGADAKGGDKAPSLMTPTAIGLSESDLIRIVHDGTMQGMPPFAQIGDSNIQAVVHYLRSLQNQSSGEGIGSQPAVPGNATAGRALFFGKAQCSRCHMMQGNGGFIAAGLSTYGRNRSPDAILHAILHPDDPLVRSSRVVTLTEKSGQKLTGVLRNEDSFSVDVQSEDGRYHMLSRSALSDIQYSDHSLMPRDYATRLTTPELNDIVSFLMVAGRDVHETEKQETSSQER